MNTIIAGIFVTAEERDRAAHHIETAGFHRDTMARFHYSPVGQRPPPPTEPGAASAPEARRSDVGAAQGAGIGAVAGAIAMPLVAPGAAVVGAAIGAYTGSLVGTGAGGADYPDDPELSTPVRHGGPVLAVVAMADRDVQMLVRLLADQGAVQVEKALGLIKDGDWADFDPYSVPELLVDRIV